MRTDGEAGMTKLTVTCRNLVNEPKNDYLKLLPGSSCKDRYVCPILANKPSVCVGRHTILVTIVKTVPCGQTDRRR